MPTADSRASEAHAEVHSMRQHVVKVGLHDGAASAHVRRLQIYEEAL